jgi:hypothetical protein
MANYTTKIGYFVTEESNGLVVYDVDDVACKIKGATLNSYKKLNGEIDNNKLEEDIYFELRVEQSQRVETSVVD